LSILGSSARGHVKRISLSVRVERLLHRCLKGASWAFRTIKTGVMELIMEKLRDAVVIAMVAAALALVVGCEKGPAQKAGERVDRALEQDRVFGRGPVEKAGKKVDKAVDEVKR
jgi:hypothetical protein